MCSVPSMTVLFRGDSCCGSSFSVSVRYGKQFKLFVLVGLIDCNVSEICSIQPSCQENCLMCCNSCSEVNLCTRTRSLHMMFKSMKFFAVSFQTIRWLNNKVVCVTFILSFQ